MSYAIPMPHTPVANRVIPVLVVCAHAVALAVILLGNLFRPDPPKQPLGMKVNLVLMDKPDEPEKPVVEDVAPPAPIPPQQETVEQPKEPDPPEVTPPPAPVKETPKELEVIPPPKPPEEAKKPIPKPPEQPKVVKQQPEQPKVVRQPPEPPKSKVTSLEEMRKRIAAQNQNVAPPRPRVDVNDIARKIRAAAGVSVSRPSIPRAVGDPQSSIREADFDAAVAGLVSRYWREDFLASELTGPGREVLVKFVLAPDGRIIGARITKFSRVEAVDRRVAQALQQLKAQGFPAPSRYGIRSTTYEVEVRFGVKG